MAHLFGEGNWYVQQALASGKSVYGVCSEYGGDKLSIALAQGTDEIGTIGWLLAPPTNGKAIPLKPDRVSCSLGDGTWGGQDTDNDVVIEHYCLAPLPNGAAFVLLHNAVDALQKAFDDLIALYGPSASIRLNLIKGGIIDHSRYAFFDLDGFGEAWKAMVAISDVTASLLSVDES